ncbi:DMT family transporter [Pararhodobacter zhoushanensis]|uniref:DMT family transporter n=1 Tax=Pararhodobacter zhoushanensis TaxID=2479545 RepID=A0ABT3H202_9RHOB|nr:DMT family transporter [Pararhodobacter zhoushanensis]MCW1933801.1 DMT family transporter [Pararhodobacter zhoushanensis]
MSSVRGPILMVAAMAGFAIEDAFIKTLAQRIPAGEIAIALGLIGGLVFGLMVRREGGRLMDLRALKGAVLWRNLFETGAVMTMVLGVAIVPLSVVSSILQAVPLTVTLGAALFLGESVGWRRWSAILVGFVGVLMIVRPGMAGFDVLVLIPLLAVVFLTGRDLVTPSVPRDISTFKISGWGFLTGVPGGLMLLAITGDAPVMPNALEAVFMLGTAISGILAYAALVLATRAGNLGATTPFRYARLVFAMIIGVTLFGERPDAMTLAGAGLIVVAGFYTLMRNLRLRER